MAIGGIEIGQELLNVPMGEMVRSIAMAIAEAQWALDKSSMTVAELMSGQRLLRDLDSGKLLDGDGKPTDKPTIVDSRVYFGFDYDADGNRIPAKVSMMELGFAPNFYHFVDTLIEVKIAIKISGTVTEGKDTSVETKTDGKDVNYVAGGSGGWWHGWNYRNNRREKKTVMTSQVDANYTNKYNYSVEGSSKLQTKLVPVPVPAVFEERVREFLNKEKDHQDRQEEIRLEKVREIEERNFSNQPLKGVELDGQDAYVSVSNPRSFDFSSSDLTFEAWIEPFPIDGQKVPTILSLHINGNNQLRIALNSSYILSVSVLKADTEIGRVSEPVITAGSWHHIAVVCKDPLKIYINGVDKTTTQASRIVRAVASCLNIGRLKPGTAHFEGKIDEVRIWGRERTREDIQEDMNRRLKGDEEGLMGYWRFDKGSGTVARDVTGKGNDGTLKGNAQWST